MPTTATAFKQVKDNAVGTLSSAVDASTTTFTLTAGQGANFPQPGNSFWVTVWDNAIYQNNPIGDPNMEKCLVTARSTDTLTVTRAQLGTAGATHVSGAKVQLLTYAQQIIDMQTAINNLETSRLTSGADKTILTQDSTTEQLEVVKDSAPLGYTGNSHAAVVWQTRQSNNLADNTVIPSYVIQSTFTGDGVVNAATEYVGSVWHGLYVYAKKTGDASGHVITIGGELGAFGTGGYNELGGVQGTLTNLGSTKGNISGWEVILRDSPTDSAANAFDTRMQGVIARLKKYHTSSRVSSNFTASSEGEARTTGAVTGSIVRTGGAGYTNGSAVTFSGGGGSGATATIVVTAGAITGITITAGGTGYTSPPVMSFTGGQGAIVDAIIGNHNQMVDSILYGNSQGVQWWKRGLDFGNFNFTTNEVISMQGGGYLSDRIAGGVAIGGSFAYSKPLKISAAMTLTAKHPTIVYCTSSSAAFTITLPTAVDNDGLMFILKRRGNTAAHDITVSAISGQTIDLGTSTTGAATQTRILNENNASMTIVSDGANWLTIATVGSVT